jgi:RNA polymerase sigma-70 factor (ECF subfamily)
MGVLSDEELVSHYRTVVGWQREKFLNQLFERHHTRVAAWCYRMTGDVDSAADLAQEVFLKAFQNLDSFRGQSKFTTWLYSIARNQCMDALNSAVGRKEFRRSPYVCSFISHWLSCTSVFPIDSHHVFIETRT